MKYFNAINNEINILINIINDLILESKIYGMREYDNECPTNEDINILLNKLISILNISDKCHIVNGYIFLNPN